MITINRGMYLEEVINRTISFYESKDICLIEKRSIPTKIIKKLDGNRFVGTILSKSSVDYTGNINGHHVEFEAKETASDYFDLSKIQNHQFEWMKKSLQNNSLVYLIIYFSKHDAFLFIPFSEVLKIKKPRRIKFEDWSTRFLINLEFPGIINFVKKM